MVSTLILLCCVICSGEEIVGRLIFFVINCSVRLGPGSLISDEAVEIWEAVKEQVAANASELKQMEEEVKEQLSGKPKKKKKKLKNKKKAGEGVVVGGVDLSEIDFNFNDIDSDSDDGKMNL